MSFRTLVKVVILFLLCSPTGAQETFYTHIAGLQPARMAIYCQWDSLLAAKDDTSWDAWAFVTEGDSVVRWKAEVTIRGKFRRTRCAFPPLELNLKKGELRERGMQEFDKLKLVTHCNSEDSRPEDLMEELLIYKLYNVMTDQSFHVTSLQIDYLYPNGKPYRKNALALMLEPTSELAYRTKGVELEGYSVPPDSLDARSYLCNALFQFMVGNADWNQSLQRNIKMVGEPAGTGYHVIPYDFDFSAIVSPSYAMMTRDYGLQDFRDRVYLGEYFTDQIPEAIRDFLTYKAALISCVKNFDSLCKARRRQIVDYMEDFFVFIETPGQPIAYGTLIRYE